MISCLIFALMLASIALLPSATASLINLKELKTKIRSSFCKIDKPLHEWNEGECKHYFGSLHHVHVLSHPCAKELMELFHFGNDLLNSSKFVNLTNCNNPGYFDYAHLGVISKEIELVSTIYDNQVCENGVYYENLTEMVEEYPTGLEDHSLSAIKEKFPSELSAFTLSMILSPFPSLVYLRRKLGFELDEILFGHDEAGYKSPYTLTKLLMAPGCLANEYLNFFVDTDYWTVMSMKTWNVLYDIYRWYGLFLILGWIVNMGDPLAFADLFDSSKQINQFIKIQFIRVFLSIIAGNFVVNYSLEFGFFEGRDSDVIIFYVVYAYLAYLNFFIALRSFFYPSVKYLR